MSALAEEEDDASKHLLLDLEHGVKVEQTSWQLAGWQQLHTAIVEGQAESNTTHHGATASCSPRPCSLRVGITACIAITACLHCQHCLPALLSLLAITAPSLDIDEHTILQLLEACPSHVNTLDELERSLLTYACLCVSTCYSCLACCSRPLNSHHCLRIGQALLPC